jgi:hypothetical protein
VRAQVTLRLATSLALILPLARKCGALYLIDGVVSHCYSGFLLGRGTLDSGAQHVIQAQWTLSIIKRFCSTPVDIMQADDIATL